MVDISKVEETVTTLPISGKMVLNCGIFVLQKSSTREGLLFLVFHIFRVKGEKLFS